MSDPSKLTQKEWDAIWQVRHIFDKVPPDNCFFSQSLFVMDEILASRKPAPDITALIQAFFREMTAENQRALWIALDAHEREYGRLWIYRANPSSMSVSFGALPSSNSDCYPIKIT
jgi:hypothetical protein